MSSGDPAWLQGIVTSPCEALRWSSYDYRQFCVLPAYERGDIMEYPIYAMWGRALSDGVFYPIPPSMYRLELVERTPWDGERAWYQWVAHTHGHLPFCIPIEMQKVRALATGTTQHGDPSFDLEVSGVVTPEFVSRDWNGDDAPTVFYPDVSLWLGEVEDSGGPDMGGEWFEEPCHYSPYHADHVTAPVYTNFDEIFNRVIIEEASTQRWTRPSSSDV